MGEESSCVRFRQAATSWAAGHPAAFAVVVWAVPVLLLSPILLIAPRPLVALPMLVAGPVVPAAVAYGAIRRSDV